MNMSVKGRVSFLNALWKFLQKLIWVLESRCQIFSFSGFVYLCINFLNFSFDHIQVSAPQLHQGVRLPCQLRNPLLHEMETYVLEALVDMETEKRPLSDVFFMCALLSNFMYGSLIIRFVFTWKPDLIILKNCFHLICFVGGVDFLFKFLHILQHIANLTLRMVVSSQ